MNAKWILRYCPGPGWEKEFDTEAELTAELAKQICGECLEGKMTYLGEGGKFVTEDTGRGKPNTLDWRSMMATGCGCEFDVIEPDFTPWNPDPKIVAKVKDKFPAPTVCPHCAGTKIEITKNSAIYNGVEYGDWPWIYLCVNKKCWASIGMHPRTGIPLGTLATAPLRKARMEAKNLFNPLWQSGEMARSYAYVWLAKQMKIPTEKCHFGLFTEAQCKLATQLIVDRHKTPAAEEPDWKKKLKMAKVSSKHSFQSFKQVKSLK